VIVVRDTPQAAQPTVPSMCRPCSFPDVPANREHKEMILLCDAASVL
jgi:hypothetical protein